MERNRTWRNELSSAALGAALLTLGIAAFAQTAPVFSLSVSPQLPYSGDRVTVTVVPQNFTATTTAFTWLRDGTVQQAASGIGRSSFSFVTDPEKIGALQVRVVVNPGSGFSTADDTASIQVIPSQAQLQKRFDDAASDFTLVASATAPDPDQIVTVEVSAFAFDKERASYQWYVNGEFRRSFSGQGRARISLPSGSEGEAKTVQVEVTTPAGVTRSKSIAIRTASMPLYWWAETEVPYWYRGKALPAAGSRITILALPNARDGTGLSYRWESSAPLQLSASGVGKSALTFRMDFPIEELVEVTAKGVGNAFEKTAAVRIKPVSPGVGIYEVRPLRGVVSERQLKDFSAPSGEPYDFLAAPFFFPRERAKSLRYLWTFNDQKITGAFDKPWLFTVRSKAGEASSNNRVGAEISDPVKGGARTSASLRADFR